MAKDSLNFTLIQTDIAWESKAQNKQRIEAYLHEAKQPLGIVLLPEMWSTGFTMQPSALAETMDGDTIDFMRSMAQKHQCILAGSIIIKENEQYYNRFVWMQPNGVCYGYDKRHLFAFAGEDQHYTPGSKRVVVQVSGWRICLQVCYDLRFPVWARNSGQEYDVLLYVANWPQRRSYAWQTLLRARAIENQCYTIGVNRVGTDGNDLAYSGNSVVLDALGQPLLEMHQEEGMRQFSLSKEALNQVRDQFPFLQDADRFLLL